VCRLAQRTAPRAHPAPLVGARRPETQIKRAREQALREKRERKQEKKDARAAARLAGETPEWDEEGAADEATPDAVPQDDADERS
jgi:hypothetical protein